MKEKPRKIDYVKPEILDLGPVTPAIGGSCTSGTNPSGVAGCAAPGSSFSYCFTGTGGSQT